jgi:HSP20 family molecular chaperone IbpA
MTQSTMTNKEEAANGATAPESMYEGICYTPRVDIRETDDEITIEADMPGCRPNDIDVQFENGQLEILGKCSPRQENVEYLLREYGVGNYHRSFTISEAVDTDQIRASYKQGVLTLALPKSAAAKPKRISVKAE